LQAFYLKNFPIFLLLSCINISSKIRFLHRCGSEELFYTRRVRYTVNMILHILNELPKALAKTIDYFAYKS